MTQVTILIVNWNGREWLESLMPTLETQTFPAFDIVVVDNGSTDGSCAWLAQHWPQVRVIALSENVGFAKANNVGIDATNAPFVLALNNDTLPEPQFVAEMVNGMADAAVGMVAARVVQWQDATLLDSAGIDVNQFGMAFQRGWGDSAENHTTPQQIFGPSGAAALYRREMLDEIGRFDETFFAYYEDVDLAWRAQRAGWRCQYQPTAIVKHWHSATGNRVTNLKLRLLSRNKWLTLAKNLDRRQILLLGAQIGAVDVAAMLVRSVQSRTLLPIRSRIAAWQRWQRLRRDRMPSKQRVPLASVFRSIRDLS